MLGVLQEILINVSAVVAPAENPTMPMNGPAQDEAESEDVGAAQARF
jgi:hypothetical protein